MSRNCAIASASRKRRHQSPRRTFHICDAFAPLGRRAIVRPLGVAGMTIVSMTGFAEAHGSRDGARWRWEVESVNGKGLDLRLRTPPGFDTIEPPARMLVNERFKRGSLQAA